MKVVVSLVLVFTFLHVKLQRAYAMEAEVVPDVSNSECIPGGGSTSERVKEYNKLEVVNNFKRSPLKAILSQRGRMAEDNPHYNQFIHCVWKNEGLMTGNEINFGMLEDLVKQAIVSVVGTTGPAMNLSMVQAMQIIKECGAIRGLTPGNKIAKIQNHIVDKLQPFANI